MTQVTRSLAVAGLLGMLVASLSATADAGPRNETGKRNVIQDAVASCGLGAEEPAPVASPLATNEDIRDLACLILWKTNGTQDTTTRGCKDVRDDTADGFATADNGAVVYSGRNCDRNEESLERKMSSVVVKMDDVIRSLKDKKIDAAAIDACAYAAKVYDLVGAGKLDLGNEDLAADAEDIVAALGRTCD